MEENNWFIKATGMLQQNWATILESKDIASIYFVNDHGRLFDSINYKHYNEAKNKLLNNGFYELDLNDQDNYFSKICPHKVEESKPMVHRQIYSSGEYGDW